MVPEGLTGAVEKNNKPDKVMTGTIEKYLIKIRKATSRSGIYAYRGQANSQWSLHSSATRRLISEHGSERLADPGSPELHNRYHRERLLEPARTRGFDIDDGRKISDLQLLAKLQHFGAATGLLDFTWNPLVALWFASQEPEWDGTLFIINTNDTVHVERVSNDTKMHDMETVFSRTDSSSPSLSYWEPAWSGDAVSRILRQRSMFIIGRPLIPEYRGATIKQMSVMKNDKMSILQDLKLLDVTQSTLFQDIHGFAQAESAALLLSQSQDPAEHLRRGNQFYQERQYAEAIESYGACIASEPAVCEAYLLRGNAKATLGDHEKAIEDYDKAEFCKDRPFLSPDPATMKWNLNPFLFMVYFNRGNAKSALANYEGALKDYTAAIDDWKGGDTTNSQLYFNRANTYADLGKFEEAVADYDKVNPGFRNAHWNKGNALVVLGRFDEALRCYQEPALNGVDSNLVEMNRRAVKRIIDRTRGREFETSFEQSSPDVRASTNMWVRIAGEHLDPERLVFAGNAGNTGNYGGRGLPGGAGFGGKLPIFVHVGVPAEEG